MNRRGFLGALLGSLVLDPERALWVPGRKLISIPKSDSINYWKGGEFNYHAGDIIHIFNEYTETDLRLGFYARHTIVAVLK